MKHIEELMKSMDEEKSRREAEKELLEEMEYVEKKHTKAIGFRMDEANVHLLDHVCKEYDISRSAFLTDVVISTVYDLLEKLKEDPFELKKEYLKEKMQLEKENN